MIHLVDPAAGRRVEDLVRFCLDEHHGGRRLFLNMVTSLDGATAAGGESAPLSDPDDKALFMALRAASDLVLVGAGTARVENYGPIRLSPSAQAARTERGLPALPRLAIVSRSLDLDPAARFFTEGENRPILVTGSRATADHLPEAEVVVAGNERAEPARMLELLAERGYETVLCEGGPSLNSELAAADLIDEIDLSFTPHLVGGASSRLLPNAPLLELPFRLERLMTGDRMLFARYLRV